MEESADVSQADVRRWARENDIEVPSRGRIADDVIQRYIDEHATPESSDAPDDAPAESATTQVDDVITDDALAAGEDRDDGNDPDVDAARERYQRAWVGGTGFDVDWHDTVPQRNRVSVQTLDNGFIHGQRATGTDEVQARLAAHGFYAGGAHGLADEATVLAYAHFQASVGVAGTGIPERVSLEALGFDVVD